MNDMLERSSLLDEFNMLELTYALTRDYGGEKTVELLVVEPVISLIVYNELLHVYNIHQTS